MADSYLSWVSLSHAIAIFGFLSSIIAGSILISLNLFYVKKVFGSYKYLVIIFTCLGMVFATLEVVFFPNMHSFNSATLYFTLSPLFGLSTNMLSASLGLFFRNSTSENKLIFFEGWRSLTWVAYVLYFGAQWAIGAYNFVKTDEVAKNYFREEMILRYNVCVDNLSSLAMVAFDPSSGDIRWWNLMTVVNMSFIMAIQYAIMIHCGYSMFTKMEEKLQNFSTMHKNHHKQLFKTLMLQITVPSIFLFIPLSFIIYIPLLEIQLSLPTGVLLSGFSLYPAADSIMVMYIVAEYRNTLKSHALSSIIAGSTNQPVNSKVCLLGTSQLQRAVFSEVMAIVPFACVNSASDTNRATVAQPELARHLQQRANYSRGKFNYSRGLHDKDFEDLFFMSPDL
ncbi:Protein CBR-STR-10 [Caenorhabditis briggsae]|uniref:Protein CBR-STR-10 n=1 Tax=Caenorhabditis briggsae TaxID=6238 RepID=A8WZF4_CAEBR|nr:Protein CBR-STR-10 [Caenorhabditis briggsae]CAP25764.1 Protein CBR-STR-10 [Caenorhabditis briggsae]